MPNHHTSPSRISPTLLWISGGSCSGESMAMLGGHGQATDLLDQLERDGIRPSRQLLKRAEAKKCASESRLI